MGFSSQICPNTPKTNYLVIVIETASHGIFFKFVCLFFSSIGGQQKYDGNISWLADKPCAPQKLLK